MPQKSPAERRKQVVRTMNELGDLILKFDEMSKSHLDNGAAVTGFGQVISSIKTVREALQTQYNELLAGGR